MPNAKSLFLFALILLSAALQSEAQSFVKSNGRHFTINGMPYYFIGTNYWYGALLGSTGQNGDRKRLIKELNALKKSGITNLRVLVGAEGPDNIKFRVTPSLQVSPGVYNDTLLQGLDFFLAELNKRDMKAVIYLQNSWDWSGGFAQYLNWNAYGDIKYMQDHSWAEYQAYNTQYHQCEPCKKQLEDHIRFIIGRTNSVSGLKYTSDPAIMAWEIANEPRPFSEANIPLFKAWIAASAKLIKSLDKNHLVTTGSEGKMGTESSMALFEEIHADKNIDYLTIHIWPKNWSWIDSKDIAGTLDSGIAKTRKYLDEHIKSAKKLKKPLVLEEFGLPRDGHSFDKKSKTLSRDAYYEIALKAVLDNSKKRDVLSGCNFWAYGGTAIPDNTDPFWQNGEPLTGDPPQEEQGLNSVFEGDSTMKLIKSYNQKIRETLGLK